MHGNVSLRAELHDLHRISGRLAMARICMDNKKIREFFENWVKRAISINLSALQRIKILENSLRISNKGKTALIHAKFIYLWVCTVY